MQTVKGFAVLRTNVRKTELTVNKDKQGHRSHCYSVKKKPTRGYWSVEHTFPIQNPH